MLETGNLVLQAQTYLDLAKSVYTFYGFSTLVVVYFVYKIFVSMPTYGFSKESSLDLSLLAVLTFVTSFLLIVDNFLSFTDIYGYYLVQGWFISVISVIAFIYLACKTSKWSTFKVLDIFTIPGLRSISILFLVVGVTFLNIYFIVSALILILWSFVLRKSYKNNFSSLLFIAFDKPDEYSFIGASFLFGFLLLSVLSGIGLWLHYSSIPLIILNFLILLFIVYLFVYRSKKFKVKWHIQMNLYKSKNKDSAKKEVLSQQKLID